VPMHPGMARVIALLTLLVVALVPAAAQARDHDKLPDRWERKHHLNPRKNDAKRDRDRDGLSNLREYRAHTNPRKKDSDRDRLRDGVERRFGFNPRDRDSDDDGIKDGRENAGKVKRLSAGSVTIKLAAGGRLTAQLACGASGGAPPADLPAGDDPAEDAADDASEDAGDEPSEDVPSEEDPVDDPEGDDSGDDDVEAVAAQDDPSLEDDDADFDRQFEEESTSGDQGDCGRLRKGARIHEAIVDRTAAGAVIYAVTLVHRR
jgi:hypothetical protein